MYRMGRGKRLKPPNEDENILRLPSHITLEILSRLPVKTIIHCSCVCKAWRTLLLDPCFPQIHLAKSSTSLMLWPSLRHYWLIESETDFRKRNMSKFNCKSVIGVGRSFIVGSCNGLLCLSNIQPKQQYHVWNPVKNDYITLPMPNLLINTKKYCITQTSAGFGFCPRTNVYKVIRMATDGWPLASRNSKKARCEVYTLGTNAWRTIQDVPKPYGGHNICNCNMSLNGAVHWFSCFNIDDENCLWVCAFRIEDEKWDPILLPLPLLQHPHFNVARWDLELGVVENCLAIFDRSRVSLLDIWMMKDYGVRESWTKCWSIENREKVFEISVPSLLPLKLTKNGDLLMYDWVNQDFVRFDPRTRLITQKEKIYGIPKRQRERHMIRCIAYVASFISPTQVVIKDGC